MGWNLLADAIEFARQVGTSVAGTISWVIFLADSLGYFTKGKWALARPFLRAVWIVALLFAVVSVWRQERALRVVAESTAQQMKVELRAMTAQRDNLASNLAQIQTLAMELAVDKSDANARTPQMIADALAKIGASSKGLPSPASPPRQFAVRWSKAKGQDGLLQIELVSLGPQVNNFPHNLELRGFRSWSSTLGMFIEPLDAAGWPPVLLHTSDQIRRQAGFTVRVSPFAPVWNDFGTVRENPFSKLEFGSSTEWQARLAVVYGLNAEEMEEASLCFVRRNGTLQSLAQCRGD